MIRELKVKRAINGDEKAFIELIDDKKESIYKIAYSYVKNEQEALDIVQETVYKAYISIDTLKKPKYFNTWLTKIAINISINTVNKNKRTVYLQEKVEGTTEESNREEKLDVLNAIEKLDEKHKKVIVLKYFNDLTVKEISQVLEIPLGTAKTYLNRGLCSLRALMGEESL